MYFHINVKVFSKIAKLLIQNGILINHKNDNQLTPLQYAVVNNSIESLCFIIEYNKLINGN